MQKRTAFTWVIMFAVAFILDSIGHIGLTGTYVEKELAGALKPMGSINFLPLVVEYVLITTGILYLLTQTNAFKKPVSYAATIGAIVGLMVYGIYGLINVTLLVKWSWSVVVIDTVIGVVVMAISAAVAHFIYRKLH